MAVKHVAAVHPLARINWLSTTIIFAPLVGFIVGLRTVPLRRETLVLSLVQYFLSALGITAGYHRLWSHRAYCATRPVQIFLLAWGAAAFQGSARWWCRNHRAHHRYVDSERDPYCIRKGFWYAHIGWMLVKQDSRTIGRVDISDLNQNALILLQHRNYLPIAVLFGYIVPLTVAHFGWGDFKGAFVYACCARIFFLHQSTSLVNSLAHTHGDQPYSEEHTSCDSVVTACLTLGEGYHNFHHEFPHDYRNGNRWFHFDPTKWTIWILFVLGLCSRLRQCCNNEIKKAKVQVYQQSLDREASRIDWGIAVDKLPFWDWDFVREQAEKGETLIVIDGIVHDLQNFLLDHPGGSKILEFWNGRDATMAFAGEVYRHSKHARNLLANFRVARLTEVLE